MLHLKQPTKQIVQQYIDQFNQVSLKLDPNEILSPNWLEDYIRTV